MKNLPNGRHMFDPCIRVYGLYNHYHCLQLDSVRHGSTTLQSNTVKLQLLEIFGTSYR